jgi:hypothetical protein
MTREDRGKLQSFISEISGLRSRTPEEKKFKDWKEKVEKKLDEVFGKGSSEAAGFGRIRFFAFDRHGRTKDDPLNEGELKEYIARLDEARRYLGRFV